MNPHDPRGNGPYGGSDTSSFYSMRSGSTGSTGSSEDSIGSFWSSSDSQSFVWTEDPRGFYGVRGAVTRKADEHDNRRVRVAAHILSGPFAQCSKALYSKKHGRYCSDREREAGSGGGSRSSSCSTRKSQRRRHGSEPAHRGFHGPPPQPMPNHHQQYQHHGAPRGPPPPRPPPPQQQHPATSGFENGFIQIPTAPGPRGPPERPDAAWSWNAPRHDVEVFD